MKHVLLTAFIATAAAIAAPRDLHEAGAFVMRVGVVLIRAGLVLYGGYDAGEEPADDNFEFPGQRAAAARFS